jgi:hypothetical protein
MRPLEDMHVGHRIALAVIIVLVIMFILAMIGYFSGRWEAEAQAVTVAPSKYDDHIDELERQAIDEAFKKHLIQLYSVWVTDNYQPRFPPKAVVGMRNNRDAYIRAMDAIEKRTHPPRAQ